MKDLLKIIDRFVITGRGTVYLTENCFRSRICVGDVFFDLHGNHLRVKGINMAGRPSEGADIEDLPLGIAFDLLDGKDAVGNILVGEHSRVSFLFCGQPFNPAKVDEDFEEEYRAASQENECAILSFEDLEEGKLTLHGDPISGLTIYRGWMMKPDQYRVLYSKLAAKNIYLINTPEEYEKYHLLPGWYDDFRDDTPVSMWEDKGTVESALQILRTHKGPFVIKDYVKSRKHEWYDACFIREASDRPNTEKIVTNFVERQGCDLVGGVVFRKYEKLRQIGFHEKSGMPLSEEYRVFVFAGKLMVAGDYWRDDGKAYFSEDEQKWINSCIRKIESGFVTMDLARREDGKLIIIELGDGQVSGLQNIDPIQFYAKFNEEFLNHVRKKVNGEPTKEEAEILYEAMQELEASGRTEIKCPRCGNDLDLE